MKKVLAAFMALAMILGMCACGSKEAPGSTSGSGKNSSSVQQPTSPEAVNWPEHEVRLVVPYKEGGGSHKIALLCKSVAKEKNLIPEPFIATCMPNASTLEGQEEVLNADPDGYTLLVHHNAMLNGYALGKQDFTYDSFEMICQLYSTPLCIGVKADSPWQTLDDMIEAIKAEPGKYTVCWSGLGGNPHFATCAFLYALGLDINNTFTPYMTSGDADAIVAVAGGNADVCFCQPNVFGDYIQSGEVRALGHSGSETINVGGVDVQCWKDLGVDTEYKLRCCIFAPKGTDVALKDKMEGVFEQIVTSEPFIAQMELDCADAEWLNQEDALEVFAATGDLMNQIAAEVNKDLFG